jgi:phosphomannomutase
MVIVDENSQVLRGDVCGGVIADSFLKPGDKLLYDVISSRAIKDYFEKKKIKTIRSRVGGYYIKKAMEENDVDFALEVSSHFYFKTTHYADSAFFALRCLIAAMDEVPDLTISDLARPFLKYFYSGVINIEIDSKDKWFEILEKLKKKYKDGDQGFEDGILVEYKNYWFNVRPSNTEPVVRMVVEAKDEKTLKEKQKEILSLIK